MYSDFITHDILNAIYNLKNCKKINLNYKCPKGTVNPNTFECPESGEHIPSSEAEPRNEFSEEISEEIIEKTDIRSTIAKVSDEVEQLEKAIKTEEQGRGRTIIIEDLIEKLEKRQKYLQALRKIDSERATIRRAPATDDEIRNNITKEIPLLDGIDIFSDNAYDQLANKLIQKLPNELQEKTNSLINRATDQSKKISRTELNDEANNLYDQIKMHLTYLEYETLTNYIQSKLPHYDLPENPYSPEEIKEYENLLQKESPDGIKTLDKISEEIIQNDKELKAAIFKYTNFHSDIINDILAGRDLRKKYKIKDILEAIKYAKHIREKLNDIRTEEDTKVWRGTRISEAFRLMKLFDETDLTNLVGKTIPGVTFQCTSWDLEIAKFFLQKNGGILYEIEVPKGSSAIAIARHSNFPHECEILLSCDATYTIIDVRQEKNGPTFIKVRYNSKSQPVKQNTRRKNETDYKIFSEIINNIIETLHEAGYFSAEIKKKKINKRHQLPPD